MWSYHGARLFAGAPVLIDSRVIVEIPEIAENQRVFPVTVDARALDGVKRIVIFADLDPIPVAVEYVPIAAQAFVATRIKLDQRTPVRAAVLTADGVWHLAGQWIDAAGGGCSAPPVSRVKGDWADHLGEMRGRAWSEQDGTRLRVALRHPMDTGLVENIPAYNLETLSVRSPAGVELAHMTIHGSVSEDPAFTMIVKGHEQSFKVVARDTSGVEFDGTIPAAQSAQP